LCFCIMFFFFSSRRRHTRFSRDWSSDVCSSDLTAIVPAATAESIALDTPPTAAQIAAVEATDTFKTNIVATASSALVVGGVKASLHTPAAQVYKGIPSVALTPAQVFAGTPLAADSVTRYVQGSLTLPVG